MNENPTKEFELEGVIYRCDADVFASLEPQLNGRMLDHDKLSKIYEIVKGPSSEEYYVFLPSELVKPTSRYLALEMEFEEE